MAASFPTRKPYPSFPLTPRTDGRFAKKIRGVYHVFGTDGDWKAAIDEYHRAASAIHAGRRPPTDASDLLTVRQVATRYLKERDTDVRAGTLSLGSWDDYRAALKRFADAVGATTIANQLGPDDFTRFAAKLRDSVGAYAYNRTRALVFAWLRYAMKADWIKPVNFGVGFRKIPAGSIRANRKPRLFTPAQVRQLLKAARPQMRAMILLGLNGGFGATDCANLNRDGVDLDNALIRYARQKTHIPRTVPLWPETVKALRSVLRATMAKRPDDRLVFRTHHGAPWVRTVRNATGKVVTKDSVSDRFGRLLRDLDLKRHFAGVGFYALRHTFSTYANEVRDSDARLHLMGRKLPGIDGDTYHEGFFLPRLKVVTDHVRSRLLKSRSREDSAIRHPAPRPVPAPEPAERRRARKRRSPP